MKPPGLNTRRVVQKRNRRNWQAFAAGERRKNTHRSGGRQHQKDTYITTSRSVIHPPEDFRRGCFIMKYPKYDPMMDSQCEMLARKACTHTIKGRVFYRPSPVGGITQIMTLAASSDVGFLIERSTRRSSLEFPTTHSRRGRDESHAISDCFCLGNISIPLADTLTCAKRHLFDD